MEISSRVLNAIQNTAISVAKQFPGVIVADDVSQETILKVLSTPSLQKALENTTDPRKLHKIARRACMKQAYELLVEYEVFSGQWTYSTKHVKNLAYKRLHGEDVSSVESADLDVALRRLKTRSDVLWGAWEEFTQNYNYPAQGPEVGRRTRLFSALAEELNRGRIQEEQEYFERHDHRTGGHYDPEHF